MRFTVVQHINAPVDAVLDAYFDPAYYASIAGSDKVAAPEVVGLDRTGDRGTVRVRYRLIAELPSAATAVIDPRKLSWIEHTDYDLTARTSRTRLLPDHYADRLVASASSTFAVDGEPARTSRTTEGDVAVRMRFVGGRVEKVIVGDLQAHLEAETGNLERFLAGRG